MKFLIDVNASGTISDWLTAQSHDVAKVADRNPRLPDEEILMWASSEDRIIVTTDKDFEEMIWRQKKSHRGILRLENLPRKERMELLRDTLAHHGDDLEKGAIVIATTSKYRVRKTR
jgi:predicted nuclease of predicted toxin-antitoxin system